MAEIKKTLTLKNKYGMHARPAMQFVELASKFTSDLVVDKDGKEVDGKSIMGMMTLAAEKGSELIVTACGDDASELVNSLEELFNSKFGEE